MGKLKERIQNAYDEINDNSTKHEIVSAISAINFFGNFNRTNTNGLLEHFTKKGLLSELEDMYNKCMNDNIKISVGSKITFNSNQDNIAGTAIIEKIIKDDSEFDIYEIKVLSYETNEDKTIPINNFKVSQDEDVYI